MLFALIIAHCGHCTFGKGTNSPVGFILSNAGYSICFHPGRFFKSARLVRSMLSEHFRNGHTVSMSSLLLTM